MSAAIVISRLTNRKNGTVNCAVKLVLISLHLTVPPTPSQELLPWLMAKKDHDADKLKSR